MRKLALLMCLLLCALPAFAQDSDIVSGDYTYRLLLDGSAQIVSYSGAEACVSVPEELNGCAVTRIGRGAFEKNEALVSLYVPPCVTFIDKEAFYGCVNLQEVTLCEGLKTIEWNAFSNCGSLEQIVLPEGLETLGSFAFASCSSLVSAHLPASLKEAGSNPFAYSDSLAQITVAPENPVFTVLEGVLFADVPDPFYASAAPEGADLSAAPVVRKLVSYPGGLTAQEYTTAPGVQMIGDRSVTNDHIVSFILSSDVTLVEDGAFRSCDELRCIEIPASVSHIGESLYAYCDRCKVYVEKGSYAEEWCRENEQRYSVIKR